MIYKFSSFFSKIRYAFQRATKGYCDLDVWNIDSWFLRVMPHMLSEFKDNLHGYPSEFLASDETQSQNAPSQEAEDLAIKEWGKTITDIIYYLQEANEDTCSIKNPYEEEWNTVTIEPKKLNTDGGLNLSKNEELSNMYFEEQRKIDHYRNDCKNKALELFSKYFWDLWD